MSTPIGPLPPSAALSPTPSRLVPPPGLASEAWAVIHAAEQRLARAEAVGDRPLIIGSAKELVEAVAKAVVIARRGSVGAGVKFGNLITEAHRALDRQPGEGLAVDDPTKQMAQATKHLASQLGLLRNEVGTGHSGTTLPAVVDESLELAVTGGLLWCRWALRRVALLLAGDLEPLIADLYGSTFRAGDLRGRLMSAGLLQLDQADARRLGIAVGQRAASGTFVVYGDGVRRCAESDDTLTWPVSYREGVALGLLLTRDGRLNALTEDMATVVALLAGTPDPAAALEYIARELEAAPLLPGLHRDPATRSRIVSAMDEVGRQLPEDALVPWQALRQRFDQPGTPA